MPQAIQVEHRRSSVIKCRRWCLWRESALQELLAMKHNRSQLASRFAPAHQSLSCVLHFVIDKKLDCACHRAGKEL